MQIHESPPFTPHPVPKSVFVPPRLWQSKRKKPNFFCKERLWVYNYVMQKTKIIQKDYSLSSMNYQLKLPFGLCQVNVGNYSFFFMTNIFSFKTAVIDGSFRLSPLVCLLAAGSSFCQGQSHMWCSAPLTENCSDSLSVIKRTMPFLVLPYIFLTIERSHKCLGRRTLHCVQ